MRTEPGHRDLDALLHDFAQSACCDTLPGAGHERCFDEQHLAAGRGPREASGHTREQRSELMPATDARERATDASTSSRAYHWHTTINS